MNLRIARKVMKAVGSPGQARYSEHQIGAAVRRYEKTRTAKEANTLFRHLARLWTATDRWNDITETDRSAQSPG